MRFSYFKLYGERNTGTNYLRKLLELNTSIKMLRGTAPENLERIQRVLPGRNWLKDWYFSATTTSNLGWKHGRVLSADELKKCQAMSQPVAFITLTKNPYSWLLSLHRRPYSYYANINPQEFDQFIQSPWITVKRENTASSLENPIVLWNVKNRAYVDLKEEFPACTLRYEDLLVDPAGVVNRIVQQFGIDGSSSEFVNVEQSTKGDQRTYEDYRTYYLEERWKSGLSEESIATINKYLDLELLDYFGYTRL